MRLRVVRCEKCGGPVTLRAGAFQAACPQCGTTGTLDQALKAEARAARKFPTPTPLQVGMKGRFRGREYELIGRLVFVQRQGGETYTWEEYELVAPGGDTLFLEWEKGDWKLMETFVPTNPIGPEHAGVLTEGAFVNLDGSSAQVTDAGRATVALVQGELTFVARTGDEVAFLDAQSLTKRYGVEWRPDEIEYYRGRAVAEREVLEAFGLKQQLAALDARLLTRRSQNLFAALCLLLALIAFATAAAGGAGGRRLDGQEWPLASVGTDGVRSRPLRLEPGKIHRLMIYGSMSQASAWVAGVLEQPDGTELIGTQGDFWDESGYDDDGAWHESDLRAQTDFMAKGAGPYVVRLYVEQDTPNGSYGNVGYELRAGVIYPTYLLTFGGIALCVSLLFFVLGSWETLQKAAAKAGDDDDD